MPDGLYRTSPAETKIQASNYPGKHRHHPRCQSSYPAVPGFNPFSTQTLAALHKQIGVARYQDDGVRCQECTNKADQQPSPDPKYRTRCKKNNQGIADQSQERLQAPFGYRLSCLGCQICVPHLFSSLRVQISFDFYRMAVPFREWDLAGYATYAIFSVQDIADCRQSPDSGNWARITTCLLIRLLFRPHQSQKLAR